MQPLGGGFSSGHRWGILGGHPGSALEKVIKLKIIKQLGIVPVRKLVWKESCCMATEEQQFVICQEREFLTQLL